MSHIFVRAFETEDLDALAAIAAAKHHRNRVGFTPLPQQFEDAQECRLLLADQMAKPGTRGAVALRDGTHVGFLFGQEQLTSPADSRAYISPPYSIGIEAHAHAVTDEEDATQIYRALYAELAERWVRTGFQHHLVTVSAEDRAAEKAWNNLGFGRMFQYAIRATDPVEEPQSETIDIRQISSKQIVDVLYLGKELLTYQRRAPMFWPLTSALKEGFRKMHEEFLADPGNAHFVAYDDGHPVGLFFFVRPDFLSPVMVPPNTTYLFMAFVTPAVRGRRIGSGLLRRSMDWAKDTGYDYCALHFLSANPLGAPFWLRHGFRPVVHIMTRTIDAQITWDPAW